MGQSAHESWPVGRARPSGHANWHEFSELSPPVIASGSHGGNINLWSSETGEKLHTLETGGKFVMSVAFSPDGSKVACGAADGTISIFDANAHKRLHKLDGHALAVRALTFSKDSATLYSGSDDAHINVYDVSAGARLVERDRARVDATIVCESCLVRTRPPERLAATHAFAWRRWALGEM